MKRIAVGLGLALATVGIGDTVASAGNVPPGLLKNGTEVYECQGIGTVNIVAAGGRVGIAADTGDRYALRDILVTDPTGEIVYYAKTYGGGPPGAGIACSAEISDPEGDALITIEVVRLPS